MSEQMLWGESLHHPGGGGGPACSYCVCLSLCLSASGCVVVLVLVVGGCLLALCLSAFVSVCLLLCGCARNPSKSWGRLCDILGRNAGAVLGIFGASPLTNLGGPLGNCLGNTSPKLRERPWASLGNPEEVLAKFGASPLAIPWQILGKSWGRPCDILGWLAPMHGPCSGKSLGKP